MTSEEIYNEVYKDGLNDAWELARKLLFTEAKGGMSLDEITECFGSEYDIARSLHMDVADAIAKYDAWKKKKKDAVHVGDLVHTKRSDRDVVVTGIVGSTPTYHAVDIRYGTNTLLLRNEFVTTGKHYDLPWLTE